MVLTLDTLHATATTAHLVTDELRAHDILILKGDQPLARCGPSSAGRPRR